VRFPHLDTVVQQRLETDFLPRLDQRAPIARLGRSRQVAFAEDSDVVIRDALRLLGVRKEIVHGVGQIGEVALDLDKVLLLAGREEEVVVVLDPLEFVRDDDGAAELAVFEGA